MEAHWFGCVLSVLCLITISIVSSAHVSFNFTQADFDFDEASNDYSYDSTAIDSEESHVRRLCSRSQALYVEDRMNCNRFYACGEDSGQRRRLDPVAGMCPPGMWFDPNHSDSEVLCVFPEVLCATNHTDAYQYCNCSANYEANAVAQIEYDLARDPLIESSPICIVDNQLHLYASKRDCERYFVCYNERIFRMQCKPGMHFNAQRGYCDALEEANCEILDPECPPIGISFMQHPRKCDMFYYCIFGEKTLQTCGFYQIWDGEQQRCVRRDVTTCLLDA